MRNESVPSSRPSNSPRADPTEHPRDLERRREHAVQAVAQRHSRKAVAAAIGVHPNSVSRWVTAAKTPGGLDAVPPPPPRSALADDQLAQLERFLLKGAKYHGWPNELWTAARVATLIARHFGINDHPEHVRRILKHRLRSTRQKPRRKARERDDAEVHRWLRDEFPRILRETKDRHAHLVFLDESGFFLTPTVRRALAPRGRTPVLAAWDRRDRLSAISAITLSPVRAKPNRSFELHPHSIQGPQVVDSLADRHRRSGPLTVVWDRSPIHDMARVVQAWLADHPGVKTEKWPAYAPTLNLDEGGMGLGEVRPAVEPGGERHGGTVGQGGGGVGACEARRGLVERVHPGDGTAGDFAVGVKGNVAHDGVSSASPLRRLLVASLS